MSYIQLFYINNMTYAYNFDINDGSYMLLQTKRSVIL